MDKTLKLKKILDAAVEKVMGQEVIETTISEIEDGVITYKITINENPV